MWYVVFTWVLKAYYENRISKKLDVFLFVKISQVSREKNTAAF